MLLNAAPSPLGLSCGNPLVSLVIAYDGPMLLCPSVESVFPDSMTKSVQTCSVFHRVCLDQGVAWEPPLARSRARLRMNGEPGPTTATIIPAIYEATVNRR